MNDLRPRYGIITIVLILLLVLRADGVLTCSYLAIVLPWLIIEFIYWLLYAIAYLIDKLS